MALVRWTVAERLAHHLAVGAANDAGIAPGTEKSMTKSLIVVPCGSAKAAVPSPAGHLYLSTYHRLDHSDVVLFGGRAYVDLVRQVWPHARTPLAGTKGIGEQQRLAGIVSAGHLN